jgi:arylsulfatase A-like enzyme
MISRRTFLGASALAPLALSAQQRAAARPNVVFILADDLGYGDLGCYGQRRIATPNIDKLATEGLRFTQAYSGATVCAPSRCCLMTGKHGGHATVRGNKKPEVGLRPDELTLPQMLKRAGYRTAIYGKWGLGGPGAGSVPNTRGFDEFYGYLDQQHAHNYYPEHLWDNQNEVFLTANWFNRRKQYAPDLFTGHALAFLERPQPQPYFLYMAYTLPHADNELGSATGNGLEVPSEEPYARQDWPAVEKGFAAMVTRLDRDVGRILAKLGDNTIVVFTSDNGPHKEGGHDPNYFGSSGPLRGIKRDLYEGGIRVPMIIRWPGHVAAGQQTDQVTAFWDFLPTFAEIAGQAAPTGIDGISMLNAWTGRAQQNHPYFYWEFHEGGFSQAVRIGDWKGVRPKTNAPVELYDLKADIGEKRNVAAGHSDVVRQISELMKSARVDSPDFPVARQ